MLFDRLSHILACTGLALVSSTSNADTFSIIEPRQINQVWLNPGLLSYHLKEKGQNNNNYGIGAEYRFSSVSSVAVGVFNNSFRETSHYAGVFWQPVGVGGFRMGAALGAINGYAKERHGNWFFLAIPAVSIEGDVIGASLMYVPSHAKDGGAISLMLRLRVF